jgi:hypothetical protein
MIAKGFHLSSKGKVVVAVVGWAGVAVLFWHAGSSLQANLALFHGDGFIGPHLTSAPLELIPALLSLPRLIVMFQHESQALWILCR